MEFLVSYILCGTLVFKLATEQITLNFTYKKRFSSYTTKTLFSLIEEIKNFSGT